MTPTRISAIVPVHDRSRRSFLDLGGFSELLRTSEDWVLWIKLALAARVADGGPEPVSIYPRHGENTEPIFENSLLAFLEVIRWSRSWDLPTESLRVVREATWVKLLYVCDRLRRGSRRRRAARLLADAAVAVPGFTLRTDCWRNVSGCTLPVGRGRKSPA